MIHGEARARRVADVVTVAALYVQTGGAYFGVEGVDPWDEERDARTYAGPHPVVAHPPCARWGRYWFGGPSVKVRKKLGDDAGCFAAALASVRKFGGVLEHPEASHAWRKFGIPIPQKAGGWIPDPWTPNAWTCCVEQGHYGHLARKATWLYLVGHPSPPGLKWGKSQATVRMEDGFHSAEERRRAVRTGACQRLSKRQRAATPEPFRDLLIGMARACH
jgi:hypothetical protein